MKKKSLREVFKQGFFSTEEAIVFLSHPQVANYLLRTYASNENITDT